MIEAEATAHAEELGYDQTELVRDKPGREYASHAHHETFLRTFAGYATLKFTDGKSRVLAPGSEIVIETGQQHSAQVGQSGWYYLAAWREEEAKAWEGAQAALDK